MEQLLTTNDAYAKDDFTIAAIPSADQVSLLINASALNENTGTTRSLKKVSVSSIESDKIVEEEAPTTPPNNSVPTPVVSQEEQVPLPDPVTVTEVDQGEGMNEQTPT